MKPILAALVLAWLGGAQLAAAQDVDPMSAPTSVDQAKRATATAQVQEVPGEGEVTSGGAYRHTIPLELPPGRGGLTPPLALIYDSTAGNGLVGVGWTLAGLPAIARVNTGSGIQYSSSDSFAYLPGGWGSDPGPSDRLVKAQDRYHRELDGMQDFVPVGDCVYGPCSWRMRDGKGNSYYFGMDGLTPSSNAIVWERLHGVADEDAEGLTAPRMEAWLLYRVEDAAGNFYRVTWALDEEGAPTMPEKIEYTRNDRAPATQYYEVSFEPEPRSDRTPMPVWLGHRLRHIRVRAKNADGTTRETLETLYTLGYESSPVSGRSRLITLDRQGSNLSRGESASMPTMRLSWTNDAGGEHPMSAIREHPYDFTHFGVAETWAQFGDVNGDGRADLIRVIGDERQVIRSGREVVEVALGSRAGLDVPVVIRDRERANSASIRILFWTGLVGDLNRDGFDDLVLLYGTCPPSSFLLDEFCHDTLQVEYALGSATGLGAIQSGESLPIALTAPHPTFASGIHRIVLGDINGDQRADLVLFDARDRSLRVAAGSDDGLQSFVFVPADAVPPDRALPNVSHNAVRGLAVQDFNGDGYDDVVVAWSTLGANPPVHLGGDILLSYAFGSESGLGPIVDAGESTDTLFWFGHTLLAGDINGDGRGDVVMEYVGLEGSLSCRGDNRTIRYGRDLRAMFGPLVDQSLFSWLLESDPNVTYSSACNPPDQPQRQLADLNGDGIQELIDTFGAGNHRLSYLSFSNWSSFEETHEQDPSHEISTAHLPRLPSGTELVWEATAGDLNGDGNADLVMSAWGAGVRYTYYALGNSGTGVSLDGSGEALRVRDPCSGQRCPSAANTYLADINGDGKRDLVFVPKHAWEDARVHYHLSIPGTPDLLASVANGFGGSTSVGYEPAVEVTGAIEPENSTCTGASLDPSLPDLDGQTTGASCGLPDHRPRDLATRLVRDDGRGLVRSVRFEYSNGRSYPGAVRHRAALGFERVVELDEQTLSRRETLYRQDQPYQGSPALEAAWATPDRGAAVLTGRVLHAYDQVSGFGSSLASRVDDGRLAEDVPVRVRERSRVVEIYEEGVQTNTRVKRFEYDAWHNLRQVIDCADPEASPSPSDDCVTTRMRRSNHDDERWLIGRLDATWATQSDSAGSGDLVLALDAYSYEPSSVTDEIAKLITVARHDRLLFDDADLARCSDVESDPCRSEIDAGLARLVPVEQQHTYDARGLLVALQDAAGSPTTYEYDIAFQAFLARTVNALGHAVVRAQDDFGRETKVTDENGEDTRALYDPLGRPTRVFRPGTCKWTPFNMEDCPQRTLEYLSWGDPAMQRTRVTVWSSKDTSFAVDRYFNGLGLEYRSEQFSDISSVPILIEREEYYASKSGDHPSPERRFVRYTPPYFAGDEKRWIQIEHDLTGRPASVMRKKADGVTDEPLVNPSGEVVPASPAVTFTYEGVPNAKRRKVGTTDGSGHSEKSYFDGRDRIRLVTDADGKDTSYQYDAASRMTAIDPPAMERIRFGYDSWGRTRWMLDPQTSTTSYSYYDIGPPSSETNAEGNELRFEYDALLRVIQEESRTGAASSSVFSRRIYAYDARVVKGIGRLTRVIECAPQVNCTPSDPVPAGTTPERVTDIEYEARGNVSRRAVTLAGLSGSFAHAYAYDWANRLVRTYFPDSTVTYQENEYLNDGTLSRVRMVDGDYGAGAVIAEFKDHNALRQVARKDLWGASGATLVSTTYHYNAFDWLSTLESSPSSSPSMTLQSYAYSYDNNGNVTRLEDRRLPASDPTVETQTFEYDSLNRLSLATGPYGDHDYHFDGVGNVLQRGPVTYDYAPCGPQDPRRCITGTTSESGTPFYVVHDRAGRRVSRDPTPGTSTSSSRHWDYAYDPQSHLSEVRRGGALVSAMAYDYTGQRVKKTYVHSSTVSSPTAGGITTTHYFADDFELRTFAPAGGTATEESITKHIAVAGAGKLATITTGSSLAGQPSEVDVEDAAGAVPLVGSTVSGTPPGIWVYLPNHIGTSSLVVSAGTPATPQPSPPSVFTELSRGLSAGLGAVAVALLFVAAILRMLAAPVRRCRSWAAIGTAFAVSAGCVGAVGPGSASSAQVLGAGLEVTRLVYEPFGALSVENSRGFDVVTHKFTGQELDEETGLMNYGARYYDPVTARFITADPLVLTSTFDSRDLNRFAYVRNNPVIYTDPSGRYFDRAGDEFAGPANPDPSAREYGTKQDWLLNDGDRPGLDTPLIDPIDLLAGGIAGLGKSLLAKGAGTVVTSEAAAGALSLADDAARGALSLADDAAKGAMGLVDEAAQGALSFGDDVAREAGSLADDAIKSGTYGELRAAGAKDAHHVIQDAAVRDLPGYSRSAAPAVELVGPSTRLGSPHYIATQIQRQAGGGIYAAERRIGYRALRKAGLSSEKARALIEAADKYFESIGVGPSTLTRIPGNR